MGVATSNEPLQNAFFVIFNSTRESIGIQVTGKDKGKEGFKNVDFVEGKEDEYGNKLPANESICIATETTPMELELEDQKHLSGLLEEKSLNDGFELDEEEPTPEVIYPEIPLEENQPPLDILPEQEDNQVGLALEATLTDLFYLIKTATEVGGMNQQFALEAEKIVPGFLDVPVGYYTKQPSATRYKVTMENLVVAVKDTVGKMLDLPEKHLEAVRNKIRKL